MLTPAIIVVFAPIHISSPMVTNDVDMPCLSIGMSGSWKLWFKPETTTF